MNWLTILVGAAAFAYGIYTIYLRIKAPQSFGKLDAMKKACGEKPGLFLHIFSYSVLPVLVGITLIRAGIQGFALFGT